MSTEEMRMHKWGKPNPDRVSKCERPGCTAETMPSLGMLRAVAFRSSPTHRWGIYMVECTGKEAST